MPVTFTVSEIADRIQQPGQDRAAVVERIRHWTREGLLAPIGERNPGTGRDRIYPETALLNAVLLNAMADRGLQISVMRQAMAVAGQFHTKWGQAKAKKKKRLFLQIDFPDPLGLSPRFHWGNFIGAGWETSIVFDLKRLFGRLKSEGE
jgi:DNA-binding transcriptional MerR regulator